MYKSRWKVYMMIVLLIFGCKFGSQLYDKYEPNIKQYIAEAKSRPKSAVLQVENAYIRRNLNEEKIEGITLKNSSGTADIIIKEGESQTEGYLQQEFYSPIVAGIKADHSGSMFESINNNVKLLNLKEVIYGFLEDKTFNEFYSYAEGRDGHFKKKPVTLCVDEQYENEIKVAMVMALAGKCNVTQEDIDKYIDTVNQVWDKAEKVNAENLITSGLKEEILLTAEYKLGIKGANIKPLSLTNTVAVKFTVEYKEAFEKVVKSNLIMARSSLRRSDTTGYTGCTFFKQVDWTILYMLNTYTKGFELKEGSLTSSLHEDNAEKIEYGPILFTVPLENDSMFKEIGISLFQKNPAESSEEVLTKEENIETVETKEIEETEKEKDIKLTEFQKEAISDLQDAMIPIFGTLLSVCLALSALHFILKMLSPWRY